MNQNGLQIDRFWVSRFIKRNRETFTKQTARSLEKERHEISEQDIKSYFDAISLYLQKVTSHLSGTPIRPEPVARRGAVLQKLLWRKIHSHKV
jgi:hypothetical protein